MSWQWEQVSTSDEAQNQQRFLCGEPTDNTYKGLRPANDFRQKHSGLFFLYIGGWRFGDADVKALTYLSSFDFHIRETVNARYANILKNRF